ncbi:hypothetical protein SDRG_14795 [Saprolegnia diclina VS20]|uniref:Uncharacterized protein n=1 Tax=Saprolegnia diclina (strain VS20) TaxID=1156394 RepID=T0RD45_SAPDV|nr:hypothetical protein SDRG_14795 [Saprolegnia diclina VS20]EQC27472.1 hypothetical protein SDRG_14795 [Saprolegnia diclina VS20]|eukprot:XP_008619172.1 hypothetical protein SDRG_14795 [Saprolegnia diclina VS20]
MVEKLVQPSTELWTLRNSAALVASGLLSLSSVPTWIATTLAAPVVPTLVALVWDENPLVDAALVSALAVGLTDATNKVAKRIAMRVVKRLTKIAAKRVREHLALAEYLASAEQGKLLVEYARRVPSNLMLKLNEDDSDDEGVGTSWQSPIGPSSGRPLIGRQTGQ